MNLLYTKIILNFFLRFLLLIKDVFARLVVVKRSFTCLVYYHVQNNKDTYECPYYFAPLEELDAW